MEEIIAWGKRHKIIVILVFFALGGGFLYWRQHTIQAEPPRYVLASVTRGTLVSSVQGSGQVSGENQIDVKPTVSGSVLSVAVKAGDSVKAGDVIAIIDAKAAQKTVRDAAQSLKDANLSVSSAELSLQKLKQPADTLTVIQAQNALRQAQRELQKLQEGASAYDLQQAEDELRMQQQNVQLSSDGKNPVVIRKAYDNAVPALKGIAQTLQQAVTDADSVIGVDNTIANDGYESVLSVMDSSRLMLAKSLYPGTRETVAMFKKKTDALRMADEDVAHIDAAFVDAEKGINQASDLLQATYDALLATITNQNLSASALASLESNIQADRSGLTTKMSTLTSQKQTVSDAKTSYVNAQLSVAKSQVALDKLRQPADARDRAQAEERVAEAEESLVKVQRGADRIDIALAENSLAQRRSAAETAAHKLVDAQEQVADYTIRAPFDGVIAKVTARYADEASPSTALVTLLTHAQIAQISVNEVDATKIKMGQKATLTFDAIPDLTIAGTVVDVDLLGTVTQGVVNYTVKVAFETQDERIKSGMSATVSIITDIQSNVLMVPNAAVHRQGSDVTVQTLAKSSAADTATGQGVQSAIPPDVRTVQIGQSNDQSTEVVSGLQEGENVVVRTIDSATQVKQTTTSGVRIQGLGGIGGAGAFGGGGNRVSGGR